MESHHSPTVYSCMISQIPSFILLLWQILCPPFSSCRLFFQLTYYFPALSIFASLLHVAPTICAVCLYLKHETKNLINIRFNYPLLSCMHPQCDCSDTLQCDISFMELTIVFWLPLETG